MQLLLQQLSVGSRSQAAPIRAQQKRVDARLQWCKCATGSRNLAAAAMATAAGVELAVAARERIEGARWLKVNLVSDWRICQVARVDETRDSVWLRRTQPQGRTQNCAAFDEIKINSCPLSAAKTHFVSRLASRLACFHINLTLTSDNLKFAQTMSRKMNFSTS